MTPRISYIFRPKGKKSELLQDGYTGVSFVFDKPTEVFVDEKGQKTIRLGIGKKDELTRRKVILHIRKSIQTAKAHKAKKIFFEGESIALLGKKTKGPADLGILFGENAELANFEFNKFKTPPKDGWNEVTNVAFLGAVQSFKKGAERGSVVGAYINECRTLSNTPGGDMTPKILAEDAKRMAKGTSVTVKVLGIKEMKKIGMGAVLGVAKGSEQEPQFIILEYRSTKLTTGKSSLSTRSARSGQLKQPIVLIGKGVTFDTGGINLKPSNAMSDMHMDMIGGAAVITAITLAAKLKLKRNIVGLVPAVENMPSGRSYRPGDILKSLSGKTIEVLNTDAEGRVILADALTYAKQYNPALVVDIATLTGAALSALGQRATALFAREPKHEKLFRELGEESGDYVWPLPLWSEYEDDIKGNFGDVANISTGGGQSSGGAINGAMFLYQFVKDSSTSSLQGPRTAGQAYPWVHLDIAPRMTSIPSDNLSKGATGEPVRLLLRLLERFK